MTKNTSDEDMDGESTGKNDKSRGSEGGENSKNRRRIDPSSDEIRSLHDLGETLKPFSSSSSEDNQNDTEDNSSSQDSENEGGSENDS